VSEPASEMVWIPAVPLPWLGVASVRCGQCGERFWFRDRRKRYERHFLRRHGHDPRNQQSQRGVSVEEAKRIYADAGIGFQVKSP
jgi:uncharacterized C2H2 Zn-finger protein